MVMAGTEGVSRPATDESLSSRLQWLRQRREALQDKLAQKNNDLKSLCIEEAELTGVLPPEIPLEPGESPPNFRKRVGTSLTYPQNLINKLKTNGGLSKEESALELERQTEINKADDALAVLNDVSESKAVRRKHRLIYQQCQRRLQELNAQLNFYRQSHGGAPRHTQSAHIPLHSSQPHLQTTTKHRTKKPRPPLDSSGKDLSPKVESRGFLQEGGISLSPLGPEHHAYPSYPGYEFQELAPHSYPQAGSSSSSTPTSSQNRATYHAPSPVGRSSTELNSTNLNNLNNNVNNNNSNNSVYVPPDHFRNRAYSQGGNSSGAGSPHHHHHQHYQQQQQPVVTERVYRPVPNTYTEEERQMHYRQMKLKKQEVEDIMRGQQQFVQEQRYMDNEALHRRSAQIAYHEDFAGQRFDGQMNDYPVHYHHGKAQQPPPPPPPVLRQRDSVDNATLSPEHNKIHNANSKPGVDAYVPPGYWMRLDDEIVWCTDEQTMAERFGSLDRRKQSGAAHHHHLHHHQHQQHAAGVEAQSRYHTVAIGAKSGPVLNHSRPYPMQPQLQSPDTAKGPITTPTPPTSSTAASAANNNNNNRILLRTQSLGSVETWQPPPPASAPTGAASSHDGSSLEGRESADGGSSSRNSGILQPAGKPKEKEWYETSLDSGPTQPTANPQQQRAIRRASHHNPPMGPPAQKDRAPPVRSNSIPSNRRAREQLQLQMQMQMQQGQGQVQLQVSQQQQQQGQGEDAQQRPPVPQSRFVESRVLEIPAESKPSPGSQENGNESIIPLNSPTNHTVVQPGKYQPYREVTKPFEMSDFYKYSTKFRKRVEASAANEQQQQQQQQPQQQQQQQQTPANLNTQNDQNQPNNPMQRIHPPVQRNACPSYTLR